MFNFWTFFNFIVKTFVLMHNFLTFLCKRPSLSREMEERKKHDPFMN